MAKSKIRIGVLTSSRADYGIYSLLLNKIVKDSDFCLEIIAFGTHLSKFHGYTIDAIAGDGFEIIHKIASLLTNDDESSVATAYSLTALKFSDFWKDNKYDWVLCLGDRFEMAAAVQAGIPFGIRFAHIHGGETTLGAIDNIYRHQMSLAAKMHFPATDKFAIRIKEIIGNDENIFPVGSLSIDELGGLSIPSEAEFRASYDISDEFALLTFHPETILPYKNKEYANEMFKGLLSICKQIHLVITMPNADTSGYIYRKRIIDLQEACPERIQLIENFGKLNYFAAMSYCKMLIGNTSSGIIEAASFCKYVINIGDRQKGRLQSANVYNIPFNSNDMVDAFNKVSEFGRYEGSNVYHKSDTANSIINHLKN